MQTMFNNWRGLLVVLVLVLVACTGPSATPSIRISTTSTNTTYGATGTVFSANVANSSGNVTWSLSPEVGSLSANTGNTVTYFPPSLVGSPTLVTLTASLDGTTLQSVSRIDLQSPSDQALNCTAINPSDNQGIVGYSNRASFLLGETAEFKLSVPSNRKFHVAIYRDGQQSEVVYVRSNLPGQFQAMPTGRPYEQDLGWLTSVSLTIPTSWKSGLYRARFIDFANGTCFQIMFVVKGSSSTPRPPIAVLANTFTWQAYNEWGGASFYNCAAGTCGSRSTAPVITFGRPVRGVLRDNLAAGVRAVVEWLERQGYAYDLITDHDLDAEPTALDSYKILVLPRHSEYWSTNMRNRLDGFLARGQYLISLGGNQIYWKVAVRGIQMEVKKYSDDRQHTLVNETGGLWRNLGRPEARVLGNQFTVTGMGSANLAPYQVLNPNHWVLAGTGLQQDQTFGAVCSGWETDKIDLSNGPSNVELVARGTNTDPNRSGQAGADMVYQVRPEGGAVFAVGSLAFFSDACRNDPIISRITRNVFERFLGH